MTVTISPHILARINAAVEAGDYPDADSLLDEALHLIEEQRAEEHLRTLLEEGMEDVRSGRTARFTQQRREDLWQDVLRQERVTW